MEIAFMLIAIIVTVASVYGIGRTQFSHAELMRIYKEEPFIVTYHLLLSLVGVTLMFAVLCLINNDVWHLPYMFIS